MKLNKKVLGVNVKKRRESLGLSREEVSKSCGITVQMLGMLERGARGCSLDVFVSLCVALSTTSSKLLETK